MTQEIARRSPLVSVAEVRELFGAVTLLDVRWSLGGPPGHGEFLRGHLPGATYVDLESDLADPPGDRGRHPLPDPSRFGEAMRRYGVSEDRGVAVYDAVGGTSAARCWWLLRYFGHRDVRVLDGGYQAWVADGGTVETGPSTAAAGAFNARPGHLPVLDAGEVLRVADKGVLVDARAPERFRGETEPVDPVAGHIPGAVNVPTSHNFQPAEVAGPARFRPAEELAPVYDGVVGKGPVGVYCGSGVTAAHVVLALEVLGVEAALYPGSWSEWVTDPSRPVATSARP